MTTTTSPRPALRRTLSFWQVTASGVGIVIGAGIYVLLGDAVDEAGAAIWASFILAAVLSLLTGLSYAELAGMYPSAGAEYEFARRAFNEFIGFVTGWMMVAALVIAAAAVALGFGHYLEYFIDVDVRLAAAVLLLALTAVVLLGVERSIWLTIALAALQIGGLVIVIVCGAPHVGDRSLVEGATLSGVLSGAALVFFAFIGFDEVITLSEETVDAARIIPRALLASLGISTLLYVLVGIAAVSAVGPHALATSDRPLALVMESAVGDRSADVVAVIALGATANTTIMAITAASRNLFGMSRSGSLPGVIARVHARTGAPYVAAVLVCAAALLFVSTGDIGLVARATDFSVYGIFVVVNLSLIALRFRAAGQPRQFRVPIAIGGVPVLPLAGIVSTVLMLVYLEPTAWLIGFGANGLAVVTWAALRAVRGRPAAVGRMGG